VAHYRRDARRESARHAVVGDFAANITPCAFRPRGAEPATHIDYTVGAVVVQNQWAPDPTAQRPCQAPRPARFTHPGRKRGAWPLTCLGLVIAVVVFAASVHDNAVGIALLDKVAADTDTVEKALVDQGFKNA
jgi:hypothetical protein